jgi:hypothetical protein
LALCAKSRQKQGLAVALRAARTVHDAHRYLCFGITLASVCTTTSDSCVRKLPKKPAPLLLLLLLLLLPLLLLLLLPLASARVGGDDAQAGMSAATAALQRPAGDANTTLSNAPTSTSGDASASRMRRCGSPSRPLSYAAPMTVAPRTTLAEHIQKITHK